MGTKMACKDDCWEGDYEEAEEQCGASWIDAVCERKHRTVASSGRGSPLRQLARWSHDFTNQGQPMKHNRTSVTLQETINEIKLIGEEIEIG
jgi:hypothetical protein